MRTVVSSNELFHLWAHQAQSSARSNGANISFRDSMAFSYSACIGRIVTNEQGERAYLVSSRQHSRTTSRHQSMLREAIPHGATVFTTALELTNWKAEPRPDTLIVERLCEYQTLAEKAKRARRHKPYLESQAVSALREIPKICEFFGVPFPEGFDTNNLNELEAAAEKAIEADKARRAEQYAEQARKAEEYRQQREKEDKEKLAKWLIGNYNGYLGSLEYAYLRVSLADPDSVETSRGAIVPLSHIKRNVSRILAALDVVHDTGAGMEFAACFGHYTMSGIDADGVVIVGCHRFEESEIRRFAAVIGE